MKTTLWLSFTCLLITTIAAAIWLWAFEDIVLDILGGHRPSAPFTGLAFSIRDWLPAVSLPWFISAVRLTRREFLSGTAVSVFAASAALAGICVAALALIGGILPFMELVPLLRP